MIMCERPKLSKDLASQVFKSYYYLKEEMVEFCRSNGLQASGGKKELTQRIATFLDSGERLISSYNKQVKHNVGMIELTTIIESNFVCSEKHREFFKKAIGKSFSFNVVFQKWLKVNAGKTYADAVETYYKIIDEKKKNITKIDSQFEYNTYIRAFFANNKGKKLEDAIKCWNYKKSRPGHNKYEPEDLGALT